MVSRPGAVGVDERSYRRFVSPERDDDELPDAGWVARLPGAGPSPETDDPELLKLWRLGALPRLVGPGWTPILDELHGRLVALDPGYELLEAKQKFGALRFTARFAPAVNERCWELVAEAGCRASVTCELCGAPGQLRDRSYVQVLCDRCDAALPDDGVNIAPT